MDLKTWLQDKMGDEYDPDATTSENVTSLVEEVRHFRKLMNTLKAFTEDIIDWTEEYENEIGWIDDAAIIHRNPTELGDSKESKQEPVDSRS